MLHLQIVCLVMVLICAATIAVEVQPSSTEQRPEVAVYYFPNYHPGDARNTKLKGAG